MIDDYFDEYDAYPEDSIVSILSDGITLSDGKIILFDECARNFGRYAEAVSDTQYIGEMDSDDGSFMFYCSPRPVMIKFLPRIFSKSVRQRMNEWDQKINQYGYSFSDENQHRLDVAFEKLQALRRSVPDFDEKKNWKNIGKKKTIYDGINGKTIDSEEDL